MAAGYSGKENLSLEPDIDGRLQELLDLIRSKYISTSSGSRPMDLARKIQYFTLDVISTIGFGEAFGDLEADDDLNDYIKSGEQGLTVVTISAALGLTKYLQWPPIARLLGPSEKDKTGFGKMMGVARKLIDSRLEKSTVGRSDMLASFIHHGLSKEDLFSEAVLQILAGSDTTATAIRSTMLYLIAHPRIYYLLQAEVDTAVRSGVAPAAPSIVQDTTLRNLPYLQAVVREGLRIFPPVTDVVPKKVPKGGDHVTIEGKQYYLPGGTDISYNAWGVHHDKAMFGEDADHFRPERWLLEENKTNEAKLTAMRRTTEMIFGYGKYQCLGKPIAWLEITKVIFEVSRCVVMSSDPADQLEVLASFRLGSRSTRKALEIYELQRDFCAGTDVGACHRAWLISVSWLRTDSSVDAIRMESLYARERTEKAATIHFVWKKRSMGQLHGQNLAHSQSP
jgi:cytochrome P450